MVIVKILLNNFTRLRTRQSWLKLLETAVNSLVKMNGLRTRLTSTLSGLPCLGSYAWTLQVIATQPENIDELKKVLQLIWDQLPQDSIKKATLGLCESWWWTLRTYAKMNYLSDFGICNNSQCFVTMKITTCCWLFRLELKIRHRVFIYSHNFGENWNNFVKKNQNCSRISPIYTKKFWCTNLTLLSSCILSGGVF